MSDAWRYRVIAPAARDWSPSLRGSLGTIVAAPGGRTTREHQPAIGGPEIGTQITDAWSHFLGSAGNVGMVAFGVLLLVLAAGIVISQTAPAQAAGRAGAGAARRGVRFIPIVGAVAG